MNPNFNRAQKLPSLDALLVPANLAETGLCTAAVPAASSGGVSPLERTRGGTPRELAGEDARATSIPA